MNRWLSKHQIGTATDILLDREAGARYPNFIVYLTVYVTFNDALFSKVTM